MSFAVQSAVARGVVTWVPLLCVGWRGSLRRYVNREEMMDLSGLVCLAIKDGDAAAGADADARDVASPLLLTHTR